jgi:hypothetical protein
MSDPGFPITVAPVQTGTGRFTSGVTGQVTTASYSAKTLIGYGDKSGNDSSGWPESLEENPYQRVVIRGLGTGMVHAHGSNPVNGDSYSGFAPVSYLSNGTTVVIANPFTNANGADGHAPELWEKLKSKLIDRLNSQKFNAAQFVAERRQLAGLVGGTAHKIANSLAALRRGRFAEAARSLTGSTGRRGGKIGGIRRNLGGIPEQWLALQYGWKPLLGDIYGAAEELANAVTDVDPPVVSVRVSSSCVKSAMKYEVQRPGLFPTIQWERTSSKTHGYAFIECKLASDFGQTLARTGITNPYQLAWELLPWSFVVDWALPVGRYLTQLNFDVGLRFSRGWWNAKTTDTWTASVIKNVVKSGNLTINWSGGPIYSVEGMRFDRFVIGSLPTPSLPRLQNPFSLVHTANALSLMAVGFGRDKNTFNFMRHLNRG